MLFTDIHIDLSFETQPQVIWQGEGPITITYTFTEPAQRIVESTAEVLPLEKEATRE